MVKTRFSRSRKLGYRKGALYKGKRSARSYVKTYGKMPFLRQGPSMKYRYMKYRKGKGMGYRHKIGRYAKTIAKAAGRIRIKKGGLSSYKIPRVIKEPVLKQQELKRNPNKVLENVVSLSLDNLFCIDNIKSFTARDLDDNKELSNDTSLKLMSNINNDIFSLVPPVPFNSFNTKLSSSVTDTRLYLKKTNIVIDNIMKAEPVVLFDFKYPFFVNKYVYNEVVHDVFNNSTLFDLIVNNASYFDPYYNRFYRIKAAGDVVRGKFIDELRINGALRNIVARQFLAFLFKQTPFDVFLYSSNDYTFKAENYRNLNISSVTGLVGAALGNPLLMAAGLFGMMGSHYQVDPSLLRQMKNAIISNITSLRADLHEKLTDNVMASFLAFELMGSSFKFLETFLFNLTDEAKLGFIESIITAHVCISEQTNKYSRYLRGFIDGKLFRNTITKVNGTDVETVVELDDTVFRGIRTMIKEGCLKMEILHPDNKYVYYPTTYGSLLYLVPTAKDVSVNVKLIQKYVVGLKGYVKWLVRIKDKNKLADLTKESIKYLRDYCPRALPIDYDRVLRTDIIHG